MAIDFTLWSKFLPSSQTLPSTSVNVRIFYLAFTKANFILENGQRIQKRRICLKSAKGFLPNVHELKVLLPPDLLEHGTCLAWPTWSKGNGANSNGQMLISSGPHSLMQEAFTMEKRLQWFFVLFFDFFVAGEKILNCCTCPLTSFLDMAEELLQEKLLLSSILSNGWMMKQRRSVMLNGR